MRPTSVGEVLWLFLRPLCDVCNLFWQTWHWFSKYTSYHQSGMKRMVQRSRNELSLEQKYWSVVSEVTLIFSSSAGFFQYHSVSFNPVLSIPFSPVLDRSDVFSLVGRWEMGWSLWDSCSRFEWGLVLFHQSELLNFGEKETGELYVTHLRSVLKHC